MSAMFKIWALITNEQRIVPKLRPFRLWKMSQVNHPGDETLRFNDSSMEIRGFTVFVCEAFPIYSVIILLVLRTDPQVQKLHEVLPWAWKLGKNSLLSIDLDWKKCQKIGLSTIFSVY